MRGMVSDREGELEGESRVRVLLGHACHQAEHASDFTIAGASARVTTPRAGASGATYASGRERMVSMVPDWCRWR